MTAFVQHALRGIPVKRHWCPNNCGKKVVWRWYIEPWNQKRQREEKKAYMCEFCHGLWTKEELKSQ